MPIIGDGGIRNVDRMDDGIVISFDDGRTAVYSTELLRSVFSQARELIPEAEDLEY